MTSFNAAVSGFKGLPACGGFVEGGSVFSERRRRVCVFAESCNEFAAVFILAPFSLTLRASKACHLNVKCVSSLSDGPDRIRRFRAPCERRGQFVILGYYGGE